VFAQTIDPVGLGTVAGLARPGANTTGFLNMEFSFSAKWLELLKEIAPGVVRAGVPWGRLGRSSPTIAVAKTSEGYHPLAPWGSIGQMGTPKSIGSRGAAMGSMGSQPQAARADPRTHFPRIPQGDIIL
jgi:hypothetical protein